MISDPLRGELRCGMPGEPPQTQHGFESPRRRLREVLGLDLRALAALRILAALLLLASLSDRLRDFASFYTNAGVLSEASARNGARFEPWDGVSWLHPFAWLPDPWGSACLFASAAVAAIFLLAGRQTRPACFLAWLMLTGIDNRNPLVIDGGDDLLRLLLFWGLFLPLSARWSVDSLALPSARSEPFVSIGTVAFLVQLALLYPISASLKSYRDWVTDGGALHYALHLEQFVTPLGIRLRDHLPIRWLSPATWWLELAGPLLLFSPFATASLRCLLFLAFAGLHVGIGLTLGLWLFSSVCVVAWLVILPSGFWDRLERIVAPVEVPARSPPPEVPASSRGGRFASDLLAASFLLYVVLWNFGSLNPGTRDSWFPFEARWLGYQLRIGQLWGMFTPSPAKVSSWLELQARTGQGVVIWLRPDGRICDRCPTKPERVLTERWRKFHERVVQEQGSGLDERYASFLLKRFQSFDEGKPAKVTVSWVIKRSPPPTSSRGDPKEETQVLASAE
jgi:hypothetical protein